MRNIITLLFPLLYLSSYAQDVKEKTHVFIGVETGFNLTLSESYGDKILEDMYGLSFDYVFTKTRSVKAKIMYMKMKTTADVYNKYYSEYRDVTYDAEYIVIPVLYKWQYGKGNVRGFLQGGFYLGIEYSSNYTNYPLNYSKSPNDFGISLGTGIHFPIIADKLFIQSEIGLYEGFFSKVPESDDTPKQIMPEGTLTNLTYSIGFSYKF